jgi:hemerythrin superfamily protein
MTSHAGAAHTDAIDLLTSDHRKVDALFEEYESLNGGEPERKRQLIDEMIHELSVHAAIEEEILYPYLRREVQGGAELADEGIQEHQEIKELLADLERLDPQKEVFDQKVDQLIAQLIADVRHHVEEEETQFFPRLREAASADEIAKLGSLLEAAKKLAPTHPHPKAPTTPPGNVIAGAAAAVMDKARDKLKRNG